MLSKLFPLFFIFLASCGPTPHEPASSKRPLVLVSIAPYRFLAEKIGGGAVEVQTITPARSNPHAFEPTSRQVADISKGQVWFRIGEPFEEKVLSLFLGKSLDLKVADLRDGIELQPADGESSCHHGCLDHLDRHIWLSPKLVAQQAVKMAAVLSDRFPDEAERFQKNLTDFLTEIRELDQEIQSLLAPLKERSFIVSHSAFGYFCRDYQLEQLSVEQEGKDPRPRHLEEMLEKARRVHAAVALALPQHNNKGVQIIAKEMKVPIRMIDPYSDDYFATLRNLARMIRDPRSELLRE